MFRNATSRIFQKKLYPCDSVDKLLKLFLWMFFSFYPWLTNLPLFFFEALKIKKNCKGKLAMEEKDNGHKMPVELESDPSELFDSKELVGNGFALKFFF